MNAEQTVWSKPKAWINTMLHSDNVHGLIMHGEAGIGKTYNTYQILKELGTDFIIRESKGTPLGVYIFLYENQDKTIVLDDMMAFWSDETVRGLLMSALWDKGDGKRYVSWMTSKILNGSDGDEQVPTRFEFKGKIIFLSNYLPDGEEYEPFLSRCLICEIAMPWKEKLAYFREIGEKRGIVKEVLDHVLDGIDDSFVTFNFRTIQKVADFRKSYPARWKSLTAELLKCDKEMKLLKTLIQSRKPVEHQAKEFWEKTGKSRASFYRMKKQFGSRWAE